MLNDFVNNLGTQEEIFEKEWKTAEGQERKNSHSQKLMCGAGKGNNEK